MTSGGTNNGRQWRPQVNGALIEDEGSVEPKNNNNNNDNDNLGIGSAANGRAHNGAQKKLKINKKISRIQCTPDEN